MDGMEEKLGAILSDPASMEQIMNIARTLGAAAPSQPAADPAPPSSADETADPQTAASSEGLPLPGIGDLQSVMSVLQDGGKMNTRQLTLLNALRPFLNSTRRNSIDRAIRIARLSGIAEAAIRHGGLRFGKGEQHV